MDQDTLTAMVEEEANYFNQDRTLAELKGTILDVRQTQYVVGEDFEYVGAILQLNQHVWLNLDSCRVEGFSGGLYHSAPLTNQSNIQNLDDYYRDVYNSLT